MNDVRQRPDSAPARELGAELERVRLAAMLSGTELGVRLGWSPSKISRLESGKRGAGLREVVQFLTACGLTDGEQEPFIALVAGRDRDGYWLRPDDSHTGDVRSLIAQEKAADFIGAYQPRLVPGLLQTPHYADALLRWSAAVPANSVPEHVRIRVNRQEVIHTAHPPVAVFIIGAHALRTRLSSDNRVMYEQIQRLLTLSQRDGMIRVITDDAGPYSLLSDGFELLRFRDQHPLAYADTLAAGVVVEGKPGIAMYERLWDRLVDAALDVEQSRQFLASAAGRFRQEE